MEEGIDLAQVEEEKGGSPGLDVAPGQAQDRRVIEPVVGVHPVRHAREREPVEDGRGAADAPRLVDVALLDPVEPGKQPWAHATVEERPEPEHASTQLLEGLPRHSVVQDPIGHKAEAAEPSEGRTVGIVVDEVPMSVLDRSFPGEHRGDRARAIAEHGPERRPVRQHIRQEAKPLRHLPPEGVDQHEHVKIERIHATHATSV